MADDNDVRAHGLQGQGRVLEAFALVQARSGFGEGEGVRGQAFCGHIEACLGAGGIFHKEENDCLALESGHLFHRPGVDLLKALRKIKQVQDIFLAQGRDVEQILVVPEVAVVGIHFGHTPGFFEVDMDGGFLWAQKNRLGYPLKGEAEKRETGKALAQCLVVVPSCGPMVEQGFHALSLRLEFVISKRYPDKIP